MSDMNTNSPRSRIRPLASVSSGNNNPRPPRMRVRVPADAEPGTALDQARLSAEPAGKRKKRAPNSGSFQPKVSGNPNGRPTGAKGAKAMVKKSLNELVEVRTGKGKRKHTIFQALVKKEVALAFEGDWRARKNVFELAKWALGDSDNDNGPDLGAPSQEMTATGQAILDWFADELREQDRKRGEAE